MKIEYKLSVALYGMLMLATLLSSCADKTASKDQAVMSDTTGLSSSGTMRFEGEIVSIPSPVQVAAFIHKNNVPYDETLLSNIRNRSKYLNETKKALNLGVYGADLAYISNYNLGQISNDYFDVLAGLSSELGILENLDSRLVSKLNHSLTDRDSLLSLNAEFFRSADNYLKANQRPGVSSYILIGGWIESLHLSTSAAVKNKEMMIRLGEQKYSAASIGNLVNKLDDPIFNPMKGKLTELCDALNNLSSTYTYRQPINDQREKITYLRSQTTVEISEEQMAVITALVASVRNAITE